MSPPLDPTQRFSNRVENYVRYRPHYPPEILALLETECGLTRESVVADVGSGTGILTEPFLAHGNPVFGIEPNPEMRAAAERLLQQYPRFTSVAATAEATTLPRLSVDFITAGQAFHWFDATRCQVEFARILKPGGWVVLIWNDRRTLTTPFLRDYEELLKRFSTDYGQVDHKRIDMAALTRCFRTEPKKRTFPNYQHLDFEALRGRLLSSSYVPEKGQPRHEEMLEALGVLFNRYATEGQVTLEYDTLVYLDRCRRA